jgi:hypothetical protein
MRVSGAFQRSTAACWKGASEGHNRGSEFNAVPLLLSSVCNDRYRSVVRNSSQPMSSSLSVVSLVLLLELLLLLSIPFSFPLHPPPPYSFFLARCKTITAAISRQFLYAFGSAWDARLFFVLALLLSVLRLLLHCSEKEQCCLFSLRSALLLAALCSLPLEIASLFIYVRMYVCICLQVYII